MFEAGAGGAGAGTVEAVVRLQMQRTVLARIAAEIASALRHVPATDGSWRSDAQRAYTHKLGELEQELHSAWSALSVAIEEADRAIAALTRQGAGAF
ncbi:MAG: hypothetical protein ABI310_05995 [Microbacteriaceae bacterium]